MAAIARATAYSFQLFLADFGKLAKLDQFEADHKHDGGEHRVGQEAEWLRQEEQNQEDRRGSGEMPYLAATACRIDHRRLGWAAVDDERAA